MIGHAVSNVVPVVAANRIGTEGGQRFYGHSFICDERGDILAEFGAEETGVLVATLDLAAGQEATAPPSASSATAGPSFTAGSPRISERSAALEHRLRTSRRSGGRYSGCSASNGSYRQQDAAVGQRDARRRWPNLVEDSFPPSASDRGDMGDLTERDDHPHLWQRRKRRLEIVPAGRDFAPAAACSGGGRHLTALRMIAPFSFSPSSGRAP